MRVQQLIQQDDLSAASLLVERSLQRTPHDPGLLNLLGIIEARQGKYVSAEKAFRKAVLQSPKSVNTLLNLGRLYQENQQADPDFARKALETYRRILHLQPENVEAHYQSALLLVSEKEYRQSLNHLSQLPADRQTSAQALAVRLANEVGLSKQAETTLDVEHLITHPDFSEADVITVLPTLVAYNRDDLIIRLMDQINRRGKLTINTLQQLAINFERQGKPDQAQALLKKFVVEGPQLLPLLVELARLARQQKDYRRALGYLAHARDLEPGNAKIHYLFGLVCLDSDLLAEANQAFSRALTLRPDEPLYNYAMGLTTTYSSDPTKAIPYLQKYLTLKPTDPRGMLALGVAYYNHKDFDAARNPLLEAARANETAEIARFHLGSIARQEGRFAEAISKLTEVLRANPHSADALAELGQCYLQKKDYPVAHDFFERAIALSPTHYLANFGLLVLYSRTKDSREKPQAKYFESLKEKRYERARELLRTIEARPVNK